MTTKNTLNRKYSLALYLAPGVPGRLGKETNSTLQNFNRLKFIKTFKLFPNTLKGVSHRIYCES